MKHKQPKFSVRGTRENPQVILQCSECSKDIREVTEDESIDVRKGYYCKNCDDGAIHLNLSNDGYKKVFPQEPQGRGVECGVCGMKFDYNRPYGYSCSKPNCPVMPPIMCGDK